MAAPPVRVPWSGRRWLPLGAALLLLGAPGAGASRVTSELEGEVAPDEPRAAGPLAAAASEVVWDGGVRQAAQSPSEELDELAEVWGGSAAARHGGGGLGAAARAEDAETVLASAHLAANVSEVRPDAAVEGSSSMVNRTSDDTIMLALKAAHGLSQFGEGGDQSLCFVDAEGYALGCRGTCSCSLISTCFQKHLPGAAAAGETSEPVDVGICSVSVPVSVVVSVILFLGFITIVVALRMSLQWNEDEPMREQMSAVNSVVKNLGASGDSPVPVAGDRLVAAACAKPAPQPGDSFMPEEPLKAAEEPAPPSNSPEPGEVTQ